MELDVLVRILTENKNCNVSETTLNKYGKRTIENKCGFKIKVNPSPNCSTNYILEREYLWNVK